MSNQKTSSTGSSDPISGANTMDKKKTYTFDNLPTEDQGPFRQPSARTLSMQFMKSVSGICCQECGKNDPLVGSSGGGGGDPDPSEDYPSELDNLQSLLLQHKNSTISNSSISPLVLAPMKGTSIQYHDMPTIEGLLGEYMCLCQFYQVPYNAGIIATLRFSLPSLRVSGSFHDLDMMALTELLMRHANGRLRYIHRLDFTVASKEGKQPSKSAKVGFTSHGALALAKALQSTKYIHQVWVSRHRIGPYGASALFLACKDNPTIQQLNLRRCRIGQRGAFAFCEMLMNRNTRERERERDNDDNDNDDDDNNDRPGLVDVDLSSNGIGHRGTNAIERAIAEWNKKASSPLFVNLEGNLVFPEIMNGITHGLGVILCCIGGYLLSQRARDQSLTHTISCSVYTTSLLVLYMSSTLYHSFFSLQNIKYIFQVMDKCAIYVLIAGSYTPFLTVMFADKPIFSIGLLGFIWTCCFLGISVEALAPTWKWRPVFSLSMYLGMGWAAMVCLPEAHDRLPLRCIHLLVLGGVGYTAGVPFFVRDNNLDHAIWHLFVLSGSIFHWLAVYLYVAPHALTSNPAMSFLS